MDPVNPEKINLILATDCGSTTTKAILIERVGDEYRLRLRGEAPTTVEAPYEDVIVGVRNAITEVEELSGRRILDAEGRIIRPATDGEGVDLYLSTSSAGGGLQVMVMGLVRRMTAESAQRAALGAGAIVMDVLALDDGRETFERIQRLRQLRPDMLLISGGVDGGEVSRVVEMVELVAAAKPQARLGRQFLLPCIFAGNVQARPLVEQALADVAALRIVDNLRPAMDRENLDPARHAIQEEFLRHVMSHAPGYDRLLEWVDAEVMPTPAAVGNLVRQVAEHEQINVLGVDIGGATTDVFSVFAGQFTRTVSANLGMSYSISNVLAEAGLPNLLRWVPAELNAADLSDRIRNKMLRPTTIPQDQEGLQVEQAVAREALRLALEQHKSLATGLRGVRRERDLGQAFNQQHAGEGSLVDMMALDLLIGSGGVLSHAPRRSQAALMLVDAFEPRGFTRLAVDSIFMMPQLGVLASVLPEAAEQVFFRDCLIRLGTCLAPVGKVTAGRPALTVEMDGEKLEVAGGEIRLVPLAEGEKRTVTASPGRGLDLGEGPGRPVTREVEGGVVGLILDGRGRSLQHPDPTARAATLTGWYRALDLYPEQEA
ncbi:MAG TPA: glutamate mutase L [Armatimonadota bacterium]|jgi:uncharacterized protein (TIGR01319 family)